MSKSQELYSIFKAIRSANARYRTYPSNYADKLNKIMYRKNQGSKYKLAEGGAPTMQQFFDYGHPTPGLPYVFQEGGQATAGMLGSAQPGQLPMMSMGQSFADNQMQDAARYGYMAKGGQASNSNSTFPNEKLGKFIGSVRGKAEASVQRELMNAYDAPYTQQEVNQAMMQSQLPRADWGGGFQQGAGDMQGANIDYTKLAKINSTFGQKAPDLKGSINKFVNSFDNQYAKQVTISDLDKPYWKEAQGTESLNNLSKWAPETKEVYNPNFIQKAYGGIPMFAPGGPFDAYRTSGTSMLELKSSADLNNLMNTVNQIMATPGQYSMEDAEMARQYFDLLQRDYGRLNQALSTKGQSVSLNAPGDAQYTTGNSEWSVNNEKDPQGVYTWQNNSKAKPNVQVQGNQVITRGATQGQPLAVKTGESSYKVNPNIANQQNIQAQDAAGQQVQYPLTGYYGDSPVRRQSTTNASELNQGNQPNPNTVYDGRTLPTLEITAPRNQRDLSFPPDNPDEIANMVPTEAPIAPPVLGPQGAINAQSEIQYPGIDPVNEGFDPSTIPASNGLMQLDPLSRRMILDNTPQGGYGTIQNADGTYSPDRSFANPDEQALMDAEIAQRNNPTPPSTGAAGAPPSSVDPTAGMTKEQRLEYWRSQRNLPEGTVMLPPASAMSKAEKDRVIADQKAAEEAKKQAPPTSQTTGTETTTGTGTETKKEETPTTTTTTTTTGTGAGTTTTTGAGTVQQQTNPMTLGDARISAVEADYRWNPLGFMGSKDKEGNVIRDKEGRRVKRPGQVKHQRVEFGYVPMPAVGPQAAPPVTPAAPVASSTTPTAPAAASSTTPVKTPTPEELAAQAELDKKAAEVPASPPMYNQARNLSAPPTQAYGGALYRFVGGGASDFPIPGVDPTKFNQSAYDEMAAQAGPAPEGMQNPMLVTNVADYDYGRDWSGTGLTGMQAITDLKRSMDYKKEQAQLPNQLSAANLFKEQDNNDTGTYAANSGILGIGNTTTGMRMSKYGGDENSEGNIYFLDEDTIRQIMAMGGIVEYLD